jgi:glucose/arabinose dehydrogenase
MKKNISFLIALFFITQLGCAQDNPPYIETPEQIDYSYEVVVDGIDIPWGMAFINFEEMLVTEKSGILYHVKNGKKTEITGLPQIYVRGQGGLLDVALHPNFSENNTIYMTLAANTEGDEEGGNTSLYSATLKESELSNVTLLYKATPNSKKGQHWGSRIVFDKEGHVFFWCG